MANLTTDSFDGVTVPHDVAAQIINAGLAGAAIFGQFTRRNTQSHSVAFPTGDPDGFSWVGQLGLIPSVDPGDGAAVVSPAKIAGTILIANESIADSSWPIATEVGRLISESMAARADVDMTYGPDTPNPAAPVPVFDALDLASGPTLRSAVVDACQQIMSNGGTPTNVILSPSLWGSEVERRETTMTAAAPLFADLGLPLTVTVAATLKASDALVFDKAGCFALVRDDFSIEGSREAAEAWSRDGVSLRVKARLAMAIPTPAKHARAVAVASA